MPLEHLLWIKSWRQNLEVRKVEFSQGHSARKNAEGGRPHLDKELAFTQFSENRKGLRMQQNKRPRQERDCRRWNCTSQTSKADTTFPATSDISLLVCGWEGASWRSDENNSALSAPGRQASLEHFGTIKAESRLHSSLPQETAFPLQAA